MKVTGKWDTFLLRSDLKKSSSYPYLRSASELAMGGLGSGCQRRGQSGVQLSADLILAPISFEIRLNFLINKSSKDCSFQ